MDANSKSTRTLNAHFNPRPTIILLSTAPRSPTLRKLSTPLSDFSQTQITAQAARHLTDSL